MCSTLSTACDNATGTSACGPLTAATHGDLVDELLVPSRVRAYLFTGHQVSCRGATLGAGWPPAWTSPLGRSRLVCRRWQFRAEGCVLQVFGLVDGP